MKTVSIAILFLATMTNKCEESFQTSNITEIRFGTSFGMCFGYCTQTLIFNHHSVSKKLMPRSNQELKEKSCEKDYNEFETLKERIDLLAFYTLDETIGCPDCADGGAEWIEIVTSERSKKVTYEYGKEPKEVKSIISELRKYYDELGECD